jgi:hypothetical protein
MDMGFEVDTVASLSSISIMALFGALVVKIAGLSNMREQRDTAAGNFRKAKVSLLAGNLDVGSYERAAADAEASAEKYEAAKTLISLGDAQVQLGDRDSNKTAEVTKNSRARNKVPQMTQAVLDRRGDSPGVEDPQPRASEGSESETSSPLGDVMFGFIMAQLICLFAFSLGPDPVMEAVRAGEFDPNCEPCAQLHVKAKSDGIAQSSVELH